MLATLPIDAHLERIVETVRAHRAAVISAPPGAGKTTRIPPALTEDGPTIVLQPRRVAARALARRIATERGWRAGHEVGWQVRLERRFTDDTRLLVATEGILNARLQADPLLSDFQTVVLDEFHERSLHADLALALVRQAMAARDDLRLVVMSATLETAPVAQFLGGCPVIDVQGRQHTVEVSHAAGTPPVEAVREALGSSDGHILCFLPGAREIQNAADELRRTTTDAEILPLHGSLSADAQDAALAPSDRRKLILATNIAETSLTVEGVSCVIDSGLHKVLRRDPGSGIDRLETERISRDSAEQRAGRAGRTGPGTALRLWDRRDQMRTCREPEILRVDLAAPFLDVFAWGANPANFEWFEPPPVEGTGAALELLEQLGAVERGRITDLGRALRRLPLHPRLARLLLAAGGTPQAAATCAALAERWKPSATATATRSDLFLLGDRIGSAPTRVRRAAAELTDLARRLLRSGPAVATGDTPEGDGDERFLRAVLAGYPDRVARRREPGSPRLILSSGHGATLTRDSGVRDDEFLVAVEVKAGRRGPGAEARVRAASAIEPGWLETIPQDTRHEFDPATGAVRAFRRSLFDAMVVSEATAAPDPEIAASLLADAMLERGLDESSEALLRRARFAGVEVDPRELARQACTGRTSLPGFSLREWLDYDTRQTLDRLAPETLPVPSGRLVPLEYRDDGSVFASVKLQELFGLDASPTVGERSVPVTFSLLAPNGRPVQTTRDLRSFWNSTYSEVRKQLRGRYPKHPWPEDPWTATPTARPKRRR